VVISLVIPFDGDNTERWGIVISRR